MYELVQIKGYGSGQFEGVMVHCLQSIPDFQLPTTYLLLLSRGTSLSEIIKSVIRTKFNFSHTMLRLPNKLILKLTFMMISNLPLYITSFNERIAIEIFLRKNSLGYFRVAPSLAVSKRG